MAASGAFSATVLVADDDPLVRTVLRMALAALGYHVVEARDASEVAAVDPDLDLDLAILDVNMPGGSITDNLASLSVRTRVPRVLVLSGDDTAAPHVDGIVAGFARKPLDLSEFTAAIDVLLNGPDGGGGRHERP